MALAKGIVRPTVSVLVTTTKDPYASNSRTYLFPLHCLLWGYNVMLRCEVIARLQYIDVQTHLIRYLSVTTHPSMTVAKNGTDSTDQQCDYKASILCTGNWILGSIISHHQHTHFGTVSS